MASIFSKIIAGDIPCYKIAEDDDYFAFLDINPLAKGHTLVVPKIEVDYIYDLEDEVLTGLHLFAKKVAKALNETIECKRVGILVIGTEVPHAHIHLIPFVDEKQMAITNPKMKLSETEMKKLAEDVSSAYIGKQRNKTTLVFGVSLKPERYSNIALRLLKEYKHDVVAIGGRKGTVEGIDIFTGHPPLKGIDTITMYMGEERQKDHEEYLLSLKARRIIFNPGAENRKFAQRAKELGIITEEACTLVLLRTMQY